MGLKNKGLWMTETVLKSKVQKLSNLLGNSSDMFHMLADNSQTGTWIHKDYIILYANNKYAEMLGYTKEEVIGRSFFDFIPDDKTELFEARKRDRKDEKKPHPGMKSRCFTKMEVSNGCRFILQI